MMLLGFAANAMAQQNNGVVSVLEQLLVTVDENGQEILTPTEEAKPGDTLVYRVTYTNNLDNGITELRPVLPIPIGMEYLLESATPNAEVPASQILATLSKTFP